MLRRKFLIMGSKNASDMLVQNTLTNFEHLTFQQPSLVPAPQKHTLYINEGFIKQGGEKMVYFRSFSHSDSALEVPAQPLIIYQDTEISIDIINTLTTDHNFIIDDIIDSGIIKAGTSKTINFRVKNTGSYLFYDKLNAPYNRLSGLHGGIKVITINQSGDSTSHHQAFYIINEIDPAWHNQFKNNLIPSTPFTPTYSTINGFYKKKSKKMRHDIKAVNCPCHSNMLLASIN